MTAIEDWLTRQGLGKYAGVFVEQAITIEVLPDLTEQDIDRLGLPIGPRRQLIVAIDAMRVTRARQATIPATGPVPLASRAHEAERRQLTVMFCDLVGSTELTRHLKDERLWDLVEAYRSTVAKVVADYQGHVRQYLGDGVMIYFGWPSAHEDDAERCVRAALEIVQAARAVSADPPLRVRIGVATGMVIVGDASHAGNREPALALGETPNLASRLQDVAGPNEVVIASTTRRLIGERFDVTELRNCLLKGIAEPVTAWRVHALRRTEDRFETSRELLILTPLVGRENEIALLLRAWREASEGSGRAVLVTGEPGIGKSRLTHVLRERVADEAYTALRYQCSPYHVNSALYPFIERIEALAGFTRDDTTDKRLDKLERLLGGGAARLAETAALFATLLSLPADRYPPITLPPRRRLERTLDALAAHVEMLARKRPVLMVFEDAHWIDPTSQQALDVLVSRTAALPLLLVITCRPEYEVPWTDQAHVLRLDVERLDRRHGAELVDRVTQGKALPVEVAERIVDRADGVPLYVEELTKSVVESGLVQDLGDRYALLLPLRPLAIPSTLGASLLARLDRLAPVKPIIQMAACIGREFSYELMARIVAPGDGPLDQALDILTDAGLVYRRGAHPEVTYIFKHALVQDAAYDSLLTSDRRALHARIARALEQHFPARVANEPEVLARHYTESNNPAAAIRCWCEAGKLAGRRVALREASHHFQQGLSLIEQLAPSAERDDLELSIREPLNAAWTALRGWAATEVGVNAAAILELTSRHGASHARRTGLWALWVNTTTQGRIRDSLQWAYQLLAEGEKARDLDLQIFGHGAAMISTFYLGELLDARTHGDAILALYDPQQARRWMQVTAHDLRTLVGVWRCQWMWMLGYPDQAVAISDEKDAYARQLGDAFNLGFALTLGAYAFDYRCEPARLLDRVGEVDRLERERSVPFMDQVMVPQARGLALLRAGQFEEAIGSLRRGLDNWRAGGGNSRVPYLKAALAEATALNGDLNAGLALIDECLDQIARPGWEERSHFAEVLRLKAWMLDRRGESGAAEGLLREALDWARKQQAKSWELRAATTLAELLAAREKGADAQAVLEPVYEWFKEGFETHDLVKARRLLESLG
jgi:class 3 adenylate cyclase